MISIWKFILDRPSNFFGEFTVKMPTGSKPLSAGLQGDTLCIWAEVNTDAEMIDKQFIIIGTGKELTGEEGSFIDTIFQGPFVWHVYQKAV